MSPVLPDLPFSANFSSKSVSAVENFLLLTLRRVDVVIANNQVGLQIVSLKVRLKTSTHVYIKRSVASKDRTLMRA